MRVNASNAHIETVGKHGWQWWFFIYVLCDNFIMQVVGADGPDSVRHAGTEEVSIEFGARARAER
jgi:hypothetical protein